MAQKQRHGVFGAIMAGVDKYFELSYKDKAEAARQSAAEDTLTNWTNRVMDRIKEDYNLTEADTVLNEVKQTQRKVLQDHGATKTNYGVLGGFEQDLGEDTNPFGSQDIFV